MTQRIDETKIIRLAAECQQLVQTTDALLKQFLEFSPDVQTWANPPQDVERKPRMRGDLTRFAGTRFMRGCALRKAIETAVARAPDHPHNNVLGPFLGTLQTTLDRLTEQQECLSNLLQFADRIAASEILKQYGRLPEDTLYTPGCFKLAILLDHDNTRPEELLNFYIQAMKNELRDGLRGMNIQKKHLTTVQAFTDAGFYRNHTGEEVSLDRCSALAATYTDPDPHARDDLALLLKHALQDVNPKILRDYAIFLNEDINCVTLSERMSAKPSTVNWHRQEGRQAVHRALKNALYEFPTDQHAHLLREVPAIIETIAGEMMAARNAAKKPSRQQRSPVTR